MLKVLMVLVTIILMFQPHVMGEEKVIIAVASDGETLDAAVSDLAARGAYFLIVDSKGKLLKAVENPYKDNRGGAGVSAVSVTAAKRRHIQSLGREPTQWDRPTIRQAAKRRQTNSLGREPQETEFAFPISPEGATDNGRWGLSPLRGYLNSPTTIPGAHAPGYESVAPSELPSLS